MSLSWLTPLGFLGLLTLLVLLLIYIIKPNYQQKIISSTYVWKLSLKYRKKKIPISKFRNILLFVCQLLVLGACAFMLAQPFISNDRSEYRKEKIVIIDASAAMLAQTDGVTRFERAVNGVKALAAECTAQDGGKISVIVAGEKNEIVVQRAAADSLNDIYAQLDDLVAIEKDKPSGCSYGNSDMEGAMAMANTILAENADAQVIVYTSTDYRDKGNVSVVNVSSENEYNIAVLGCTAALDEGYYNFTAEIASYGRDVRANLIMDVYGVNLLPTQKISFNITLDCFDGVVTKYDFVTGDLVGSQIFAYDYVHLYVLEDDVLENDSFLYDNEFYLYGGTPPTVKIQYYSSAPNNFFSGVLMGFRDSMRSTYNIEIKEVRDSKEKPATEGFDFYIFEHTMPTKLPRDGVVFLVDPNASPEGLGMTFGNIMRGKDTLAAAKNHLLTSYMFGLSKVEITSYTQVAAHDGFEDLVYAFGEPVVLLKNEPRRKVVVMTFGLNNSTLPVMPDFPAMIYGFFEYFFPSTLSANLTEINAGVSVRARGESVYVSGPYYTDEVKEFPSSFKPELPGTYAFSQTIISNASVTDKLFVRIPLASSNINRSEAVLANPSIARSSDSVDVDLLFYFAIALIALLFAEWILQIKENF